MIAKDTIVGDDYLLPFIDPGGDTAYDDLVNILLHQAEVSFEAGFKEGFNKHRRLDETNISN